MKNNTSSPNSILKEFDEMEFRTMSRKKMMLWMNQANSEFSDHVKLFQKKYDQNYSMIIENMEVVKKKLIEKEFDDLFDFHFKLMVMGVYKQSEHLSTFLKIDEYYSVLETMIIVSREKDYISDIQYNETYKKIWTDILAWKELEVSLKNQYEKLILTLMRGLTKVEHENLKLSQKLVDLEDEALLHGIPYEELVAEFLGQHYRNKIENPKVASLPEQLKKMNHLEKINLNSQFDRSKYDKSVFENALKIKLDKNVNYKLALISALRENGYSKIADLEIKNSGDEAFMQWYNAFNQYRYRKNKVNNKKK